MKKPWDEKWSTNRNKHVAKRYCAAVRHMKDRHEVCLCNKSVFPSVRSTTTKTTEEKQEPMIKVDETDLMTYNNEDLILNNNDNSE